MTLTDEQKAILEGSRGETMSKVMESLVRYGELFGATRMVPISSKYNHLVTSFGLKALGPVYDLMDQLLEAGAPSGQKFTVDPKPLDRHVPSNPAQDLVFKMFMYSRQKDYEKQLDKLEATKKANEAAAYKAAPIKDTVSFEEFEKLDIRVGLVKDCQKVKKSKKLLQFTIEVLIAPSALVSLPSMRTQRSSSASASSSWPTLRLAP